MGSDAGLPEAFLHRVSPAYALSLVHSIGQLAGKLNIHVLRVDEIDDGPITGITISNFGFDLSRR